MILDVSKINKVIGGVFKNFLKKIKIQKISLYYTYSFVL